jgi:peptidoglycan/LPS O-acetylase OafA/YrhL
LIAWAKSAIYSAMSIGTLDIPLPESLCDDDSANKRAKPQKLASRNAAAPALVLPRNEAIDAVRAIAAAGIVFVHAAESPTFDRWGNLFRFGVPFFLFASFYYQSLSLRRNPDRPLVSFLLNRLHRLYLPFLVWSGIYLLGRDLERAPIHHLPAVTLRLSMLWTGTEYHLWFLPFLLLWSLALAGIHRTLLQFNRHWRWFAIIAVSIIGWRLSAAVIPILPPATEMTVDDPRYALTQWWLATPAACWALGFAWLMTLGPAVYSISAAMGWAGIVLLIASSIRQGFDGIALAPRGLSGLGAILTALMPWRTRVIPALARIGRKGYGIYLCHVIPVEIIHLVFHRLHMPTTGWLDVANWALSFVGAWVIVLILEQSPRTAWLNG